MLMEQPPQNPGNIPAKIDSGRESKFGPDQAYFLNTLLNHTTDGVIVLDLQGRIRTWNSSASRIYGWQLEEVLERPFAELIGSDQGEIWPGLLDTGRLGGQPAQLRQKHLSKDLATRHVNVTISLLRNHDGYRVGFLVIIQNVTDLTLAEEKVNENDERIAAQVRKQTAELNQANTVLRHQARTDRLQLAKVSQLNMQLRQVTDISRQLSGILDIEMLLAKTIALIQHHFGFYQVLIYLTDQGADELRLRQGSGEIGQRLTARGHVISLDATPSLVARAARNQQIIGVNDVRANANFLPNTLLPGTRAELAIPLVSGQTLLGVLDLQAAEPQRFGESVTNILSTLASHFTINLINAQLFADHESLLRALQVQTRELKRSNDDLEQFAYVASHDLQEPLRAVTNYLLMLQKRHTGMLSSEGNEFVHFALEGTERMKQLIADLLQFSRLGRQELRQKHLDSGELLDEALGRLAGPIKESNASLHVGRLPMIMGDPVKLVSLFQNLLSNAIKYRGEHRPVITINAERQANSWLFSITDNGIGFDTQFHDRIFLIFQRLHTREEYEGTGMGLAICKRIVEQHQGHIYAESEPGQGSTFYFTLPAIDAY